MVTVRPVSIDRSCVRQNAGSPGIQPRSGERSYGFEMPAAQFSICDTFRGLPATLLRACLIATLAASPAVAQSVWELSPYRIQVFVAFAPLPELTPPLQDDFRNRLTERIDALVGAPWDVTVTPAAPELAHAITRSIDSVTIESLLKDSLAFDKVMLLAVTVGPEGHRVAVRELDLQTRLWSTTAVRAVWQLTKLRDAAVSAVLDAFAPLAQISRVKEADVTLRPKAWGLPPRDPSLRCIVAGDAFRPVVRYNDREGNPRRITEIAWTFLTIESFSADVVEARLITGLRSPLSGRRRGRVQSLALRIVPPRSASTLTLKSRSGSESVLPGYDVYAHPPDSKRTTLVGRSDWQGRVTVPPAENALRVLLVKNGGEILARLPLVPGLQSECVAPIADDDGRLEAEGFITGLQEELVDLVTRREVLLARIEARLEDDKLDDDKLDEAAKMIDEVQRLPAAEEFSLRLKTRRAKIRTDDDATQAKINALFDDTQKLIHKHLGIDEIEELSQQLRKARGGR